jgi:DNA-directed RNA polymerase subunit N (RpoN/RPB10)
VKIRCASCDSEINLDHRVFEDYAGPVKCFCCGMMMTVKTDQGILRSLDLLTVTASDDSVSANVIQKGGP